MLYGSWIKRCKRMSGSFRFRFLLHYCPIVCLKSSFCGTFFHFSLCLGFLLFLHWDDFTWLVDDPALVFLTIHLWSVEKRNVLCWLALLIETWLIKLNSGYDRIWFLFEENCHSRNICQMESDAWIDVHIVTSWPWKKKKIFTVNRPPLVPPQHTGLQQVETLL